MSVREPTRSQPHPQPAQARPVARAKPTAPQPIPELQRHAPALLRQALLLAHQLIAQPALSAQSFFAGVSQSKLDETSNNGVTADIVMPVPRAQHLRMFRRFGDFVSEEHLFIQFFAGTYTGEFDLDIGSFFQAR